jgi:hypothetical protein
MAGFATSQPWSSQLLRLGMGEAVWAVFAALGLAALWGRAAFGQTEDRDGVGLWVAWPFAGLGAVLSAWTHQTAPFWAIPTTIAHRWPVVGGLAPAFILVGVSGFLVIFGQNRFESASPGRARAFALALGLAIGTANGGETLGGLLGSSALWGGGLCLLAEVAAATGPGMWIGLVTMTLLIARVQELRIFGWTPGGWTAVVGMLAVLGARRLLAELPKIGSSASRLG